MQLSSRVDYIKELERWRLDGYDGDEKRAIKRLWSGGGGVCDCLRPLIVQAVKIIEYIWFAIGIGHMSDFMVQGKINRGSHTDHLAGRHSMRTNQCPPPPSPHSFYRPDALPATQPTASKH